MSSSQPKKKKTAKVSSSGSTSELNSFSRSGSKKDKNGLSEEISKRTKLPNVFTISKNSLLNININWKQFSIVSAIYFFLTLLLVRGFSATVNILQLKNTYFASKHSSIGSDFSAFGSLIGTSTTSPTASNNLYQTFLFIIFSLVFIWMLRQVLINNHLNVSSNFYKSQTPLIPFIIVTIFLIIEMLPLIIGLFIYATVFSNGIAVHLLEKILLGGISLGFALISVFLLVSSVFAIYIVTLPDIRPIQALRSSWRLVKKRRMVILRKVLFLPIALVLVVSLISIIFIAIIPGIAAYVYFALSVVSLLLAHSYLYNLYREMI